MRLSNLTYYFPSATNVCSRTSSFTGGFGKNKLESHHLHNHSLSSMCLTHATLKLFGVKVDTEAENINEKHRKKVNRFDVMHLVMSASDSAIIKGISLSLGLDSSKSIHEQLCAAELRLVCFLLEPEWAKPDKIHHVQSIFYILSNYLRINPGIHPLWRTFAVCTNFLALADMQRNWKTHGYIREMLKCLPPDVHAASLHNDWKSIHWRTFVIASYHLLKFEPSPNINATVVYLKWAAQTKRPYIGKALLVRKGRQTKHYSGAVARLREHWILTFCPPPCRPEESTRQRYVEWRNSPPESTRWLILSQLPTEATALQLEAHFICCLSNPLNESCLDKYTNGTRVKLGKVKDPSHIRHRKPVNKKAEVENNYCHNFRTTLRSKYKQILFSTSVKNILRVIRETVKLSQHKFQKMLYKEGSEEYLALALAEPFARIPFVPFE